MNMICKETRKKETLNTGWKHTLGDKYLPSLLKGTKNYYLSYTLILRRLKILKILTCLEAFQVLRQQLHQQQRGQELPDDDVYVYDANVCVCMFVRHEK